MKQATHVKPASGGYMPDDTLGLSGSASVNRQRLILGFCFLSLIFVVFVGRLAWFGANHKHTVQLSSNENYDVRTMSSRPVIMDRNGATLASDVIISSAFANPKEITNVDETLEALISVLPDLDEVQLRKRLMSDRNFVWIKREVPPFERALIHSQGLGGVFFRRETKRVYPSGRIPSHLVGFVNVDNEGLSGIERHIDEQGLRQLQLTGLANKIDLSPMQLTLDLRVQHAVRDELISAMERYQALGAAGLVMDAQNGEIVALVSLPDFDPLKPEEALLKNRINRATKGTFELGSVMKTFTIAAALDTGSALRTSVYNAKGNMRHDGIEIGDYHGKDRDLTLDEVFIHSSNIGSARIALDLGARALKAFYEKLGMFDAISLEIPERTKPRLPPSWRDSSLMTISYGHGIALTPFHALKGLATLVNGGYDVKPTLIKRAHHAPQGDRLIKASTSEALRELLRLNVIQGTAKTANRDTGYRIGGKTGTADKIVDGAYLEGATINSFMGAFPMHEPRYVFYFMLDEPKAESPDKPFTTAGHNAVPTSAAIIRRIAPLLSVAPARGEEHPLSLYVAHDPQSSHYQASVKVE